MDHTTGVLIALASSCLGGSAAAVTRYLVGNADPLTLALLRWGIGFLVVLPVALVLRAKLPPRTDWLAVCVLGVCFFGLFFVLYNIAVAYTTAARASLALSTLPLQTMIVAALLGIEPLTARKSLGVAVAMLGVFTALASGLAAAPEGAWRGELIMTGAVLCMALQCVVAAFYPAVKRARISMRRNGRWRSGPLGDRCVERPDRRPRKFQRPTMDRRNLSWRLWRRARLHLVGHGIATHDADAGRQYHDH